MDISRLLKNIPAAKLLQQHFNNHLFDTLIFYYHQSLLTLSSCDLCGSSCEKYRQLCQYCHQDLPLFQFKDVQGDLLNWPAIYKNLPNINFDQLLCLAPHQMPFSHWISQLKYQGRFELAQLFGHLLADTISQLINTKKLSTPEMIVSVPLHISRWQSRGFNQAHLIAKQLQKHLARQAINIDYCSTLITRPKKTEQQVGQSGQQRRKRLRTAFQLNNTVSLAEHILLVDDVVTTGTTVSEISTLLKNHGVKTVSVVAITLAMPNDKNK